MKCPYTAIVCSNSSPTSRESFEFGITIVFRFGKRSAVSLSSEPLSQVFKVRR